MSVSPLITNNFIDSCAFNPHEPEGAAALELFALSEQGLLLLSGNWRITFRFEGKDALDVDYEDYH